MQHHLVQVHGLPGGAPGQCGFQVLQNHSGEHEQPRQVKNIKLFPAKHFNR